MLNRRDFLISSAAVAARITLPDEISGEFFWRGNRRDLQPGANSFTL
jgi:hypothetical protein